ncbi:MAG: hypothetical protein Q4C47_08515 [Planctomycetia bacterium]|nr:hypothetical protein [Planctomycetia bacterium]
MSLLLAQDYHTGKYGEREFSGTSGVLAPSKPEISRSVPDQSPFVEFSGIETDPLFCDL